MKILGTMVVAAAMMAALVSGASAATNYTTVTDWAGYDLSNTGSTAGGVWTDPAALRTGSADGLYRSPFDGSGVEDPAPNWETLQFWAIGPNNPAGNANNAATLSFGQTVLNAFTFIWGSVDSYNSVDFQLNGVSQTLLTSLVLNPAGFPTTLGAIFVEVTGISFNSIVFTSTNQEALEVSFLAAVPLPAGVLLLGSALAGLGFLGRRRKQTMTAAAA